MDIAAIDLLTLAAGALVGLTLGLVGAGGSVLAVPLLVYVIGVASPHVAIGTGAIAVAANALAGVFMHARTRTVKWPCALVFAAAGVVGAFAGAQLGKMMNGELLLMLFGIVMMVIGASMVLRRSDGGDVDVHLDRHSARRLLPSLLGFGLGVGLLSGFFGIGGGFLIVPGLIGATNMPIIYAVGSSLVSVSAFGFATASSYALAGLVDWRAAALLLTGGLGGAALGVMAAHRLAAHKTLLTRIFAALVIGIGAFVVFRGALHFR